MRCSCRFALLIALIVVGGCDRDASPGVETRGALRVETILGGDPADLGEFAQADAPRAFRFPDDHGAHPDYRSEWWYLTLTLSDEAGDEYGVQFTLFRQALAARTQPEARRMNAWRSGQVYMAHLAVSDVAQRRHRAEERIARDHPQLAGVRADPFAAWIDGWSLRVDPPERAHPVEIVGADDRARRQAAIDMLLPLRLQGRTEGFAVDLTVTSARPLALQGERGLSRKGPGQASYYLSATRMAAAGTLELDGMVREVHGFAWLDREWSTSVLTGAQIGWDWFGLRLDDGSDLMVFQLRRADGERDPYDAGLVMHPDGRFSALSARDFALEPLQWWRDPEGVRWPITWRLHRRDAEPLTVEAAFPDQRMALTFRYWEGVVHVRDAAGARVGRGYMELTGYD